MEYSPGPFISSAVAIGDESLMIAASGLPRSWFHRYVSGLPVALVDRLASSFTVVWFVVMMECFAGPAMALVSCTAGGVQPVVRNWPAVDRTCATVWVPSNGLGNGTRPR